MATLEKINYKKYIVQVEKQQRALVNSNRFSIEETLLLNEVFEEQIAICEQKIANEILVQDSIVY